MSVKWVRLAVPLNDTIFCVTNFNDCCFSDNPRKEVFGGWGEEDR